MPVGDVPSLQQHRQRLDLLAPPRQALDRPGRQHPAAGAVPLRKRSHGDLGAWQCPLGQLVVGHHVGVGDLLRVRLRDAQQDVGQGQEAGLHHLVLRRGRDIGQVQQLACLLQHLDVGTLPFERSVRAVGEQGLLDLAGVLEERLVGRAWAGGVERLERVLVLWARGRGPDRERERGDEGDQYR